MITCCFLFQSPVDDCDGLNTWFIPYSLTGLARKQSGCDVHRYKEVSHWLSVTGAWAVNLGLIATSASSSMVKPLGLVEFVREGTRSLSGRPKNA